MKIIARLLFLTALASGVGCVRTDWIDRTLVTEDVTGVWRAERGIELDLKQQGPNVTGVIRVGGGTGIRGPIEGSMAGDTLRFKQTNGSAVGELTVSGDEMTGQISGILWRPPAQYTLRRVNPQPGQPNP
jgi:hypothetical protein